VFFASAKAAVELSRISPMSCHLSLRLSGLIRVGNGPGTSPAVLALGEEGFQGAPSAGPGWLQLQNLAWEGSRGATQQALAFQPGEAALRIVLIPQHGFQASHGPAPVQDEDRLAMLDLMHQGAQIVLGLGQSGSLHLARVAIWVPGFQQAGPIRPIHRTPSKSLVFAPKGLGSVAWGETPGKGRNKNLQPRRGDGNSTRAVAPSGLLFSCGYPNLGLSPQATNPSPFGAGPLPRAVPDQDSVPPSRKANHRHVSVGSREAAEVIGIGRQDEATAKLDRCGDHMSICQMLRAGTCRRQDSAHDFGQRTVRVAHLKARLAR
jgi:hypothetical protein